MKMRLSSLELHEKEKELNERLLQERETEDRKIYWAETQVKELYREGTEINIKELENIIEKVPNNTHLVSEIIKLMDYIENDKARKIELLKKAINITNDIYIARYADTKLDEMGYSLQDRISLIKDYNERTTGVAISEITVNGSRQKIRELVL